MRTNSRLVAVCATGVLALVAAGCGGGGGGATTRAKTTTSGAAIGASDTTSSATSGVDPNAPEAPVPGDIPDTQVFVAFAASGYSVKVPEGWARRDGNGTTTFSDHYNSIRLETMAASSAPTVASVRSTEVPQLQSSTPAFALNDVTTVTRTAGPAVLVTYEANSAPDPVTGKKVRLAIERYEFWKKGTTAVITLSAAKGADNVDPWKSVTDSYTWQP